MEHIETSSRVAVRSSSTLKAAPQRPGRTARGFGYAARVVNDSPERSFRPDRNIDERLTDCHDINALLNIAASLGITF